LIRAQIARWITDVRSVYVDVAAERTLIKDAYAMVDRNAAAVRTLNDWFSNNDPFKRAETDTISVQVASVLPLSATTWRIEWREDKRSRDGTLESQENWQASVTVSINPPADDTTILVNPTGLYVETFDWTQRQ
jgi:type IV secretion system protein VirB5